MLKRCTRLFRPVFYYLAFWAVALVVLNRVLPRHVYEPVAGISIQLLWFLGVYVLVLAAMPVLHRISTPARLVGGVVVVYAMVAVVDAIRVLRDARSRRRCMRGIARRSKAWTGRGFRRSAWALGCHAIHAGQPHPDPL